MLTAGESHGKALVAVLEGLPAAVPIAPKEVAAELARRRHGHGRGGRQKLETDALDILSGIRHGGPSGRRSPSRSRTTNGTGSTATSWVSKERESGRPTDAAATGACGPRRRHEVRVRRRPQRPGACEREGDRGPRGGRRLCKAFLAELGIRIVSHVVRIGKVTARASGRPPRPEDLDAVDSSPVRCFDEAAATKMVAEIDRVRKARDTVGGEFEVIAYGCPPGLGSHVHYDRKLDARLALGLMSIQSVKGVGVGDGFASAARYGSAAHDEIVRRSGRITRATARAGGIEGGMSTGQPIRLRAR